MILDGRKMRFTSRKQLNQQKTAKKQFNLAMPIHLSKKQTVEWDHISRRLLKRNEVASPAGFEPATSCLEATQYKTLSVAYEEPRHLSRP